MIVQCNNCSSHFDVDEAMLMPAGRKLKCSNCKEVFFQPLPTVEVEETPDEEAEEGLEEDFSAETPEEIALDDESLGLDGAESEGDDETETVLASGLMENRQEPSIEETEGVGESEEGEEHSLFGQDVLDEGIEDLQVEADDGGDGENLEDLEGLEEGGLEEDEGDFGGDSSGGEEDSEESVSAVEEFEEEVSEEEVPEEDHGVDEEVGEESEDVREEPEEEQDVDVIEETVVPLDMEETDDEDKPPSRWVLALPSAKMGWVAAAVLCLSLAAGVVGTTDWWEYKWFDINSTFRLTGLDPEWRTHSVGTLLVVKGRVTNSEKMTQTVPKVRVSLLDQENNELVSSSVIPGRIIDDKLFSESTGKSLGTMIQLQSDPKRYKAVEKIRPGEELTFQAVIVNPPEKVARYRVDFDTIENKRAVGSADVHGPGEK